MKRLWPAVFLAMPAALAADESCRNLEQVAFLLGAWQSETQGARYIERWCREEDAFQGHAEVIRGGERVQQETMTLRAVAGVLVYAADPEQDGRFVEFSGVRCIPGEVVFENPRHDFPQRLRYRLDDGGILIAVVSDLQNQGFELEFRPED